MANNKPVCIFNPRKLITDEQFDVDLQQIVVFCENEHLSRRYIKKND